MNELKNLATELQKMGVDIYHNEKKNCIYINCADTQCVTYDTETNNFRFMTVGGSRTSIESTPKTVKECIDVIKSFCFKTREELNEESERIWMAMNW